MIFMTAMTKRHVVCFLAFLVILGLSFAWAYFVWGYGDGVRVGGAMVIALLSFIPFAFEGDMPESAKDSSITD